MKPVTFEIFAIFAIVVLCTIFGYLLAVFHVKEYLAPMKEAKTKCEETLPRNQECKLVYHFEPKEQK